MGSIYAKDGHLYHQYSEPIGNKKVRRQVALGLTDTELNRKKAEIIKNETDARFKMPKPILSHYYPLESAFDEFILTKKNLTESSRMLYKAAFDKFTEANGILLCSEVTQSHANKFYELLSDYSPNTMATYSRYMIAFFNYLKLKRYVREVFFVRLKSNPKKIRPIPPDTFKKMLKATTGGTNQRFLLEFLALTGFRKNEAVNLKWKDIDWDRKIIYVRSKGGDIDQFPLYNELEILLKKHRRISGSVFGYKSVHSLKFWGKQRKKIGHDYTLHDIRKTFCCRLVEQGVSVFDACKLMRHSSVKVTERYYASVSTDRLGHEAERVFGYKEELKVVTLSSQ